MTTTAGPLQTLATRIGSLWWALVVVGIAWIVVGFVVLRFDDSTVEVVSIVFGIVVLLAAVGEFFRAVVSLGAWRVWHILFGVVLVIAAVVAFVNPGGTFVSLALVAGFFFVFAGVFDIISSFFSIGFPGWWLQLLAGIAELLLGLVASNSFGDSAVLLVTSVSVLAIFRGVAEISAGFAVRVLAEAGK